MTNQTARDGGGGEPPPVDWEGLARAETYPVRIAIIDLLQRDGRQPLTAKEIAAELQLPYSNIAQHVNVLLANRILISAGHRMTRGTAARLVCLEGRVPPPSG